MNYYNEIKNIILDNEIYERVKDYTKEKHRVIVYFEIGRLLSEAGKHYGKNIIENYSKKLVVEVGKKYNVRTLRSMRQFYETFNDKFWKPLVSKLSWSIFLVIMPLKEKNIMYYYANQCIKLNLSKRQLIDKIKNNEYERLPEETKNKLVINEDNLNVQDLVKDPIVIKNTGNYEVVSEKILKQLILEDIDNFLKELGNGFCYVGNEYKIKIGNTFNYIDLLLYNIEFNCYVVVELKVTELKKEHIGQIEVYMNYVDKNIKSIYQDKTIGIIIVKKENKFVLEYSSDKRIFETEYVLN